MTQFKDKVPPTYEELMIHIKYTYAWYFSTALLSTHQYGRFHSYKLHELGRALHAETRYRKQEKSTWEGELNNFQSPCVRPSLSAYYSSISFV